MDAGILDTINDDVAQWIAILTGRGPTVPTTAQTNAAVILAQQRQQQQQLLFVGAVLFVGLYVFTRR